MATVSDIFDSVTEFEDLLSEAEESAGSEWEMDDLHNRELRAGKQLNL